MCQLSKPVSKPKLQLFLSAGTERVVLLQQSGMSVDVVQKKQKTNSRRDPAGGPLTVTPVPLKTWQGRREEAAAEASDAKLAIKTSN